MKILTPSTGQWREGGDLRLNFRQIERGMRVIYKQDGAWRVGDVIAATDSGVRLADMTDVPFSRVVCRVVMLDEAATLSNLTAFEGRNHGDTRQSARDATWALLEMEEERGAIDRLISLLPD